MNIKKLFLTTAVLTTAFSTQTIAQDGRDVVTDTRGQVIVNSFGNCVRTKWDGTNADCKNADKAVKSIKRTNKSRSYIVFFDFDSHGLSGNTKQILSSATNNIGKRNIKNTKFDVVGHADSTGPDSYNDVLSQKRAQSVKDHLISLGADANNINVTSKGESSLLVNSGDGVAEPQNRRVEVTYSTK